MNRETFIFPDDLDGLTMERLDIPDVPQDWGKGECFVERVSNIAIRDTGQMTYFLDGHKSERIFLTPEEMGWMEAGRVTPIQVACRYAVIRQTRFSGNPVQKTLFD